ncbi:hypothetical protein ACGFNV_13410 [Streptomyces sp. NPDC048751]|uniref:hypothetical protein n=1 Tax=Streptomyces sp. NPDC048751 TaxID=3365591 RepID=UPI0037148074
MLSRGRSIKLTAVAALVVLSLTGFSTSRGHGHGSSHGSGGGGGCSSSSQDHDSSSSTSGGSGSRYHDNDYDDDDDYGTSGSGGSGDTSTPVLENAATDLISCATEKAPYATVSVTNPNSAAGIFAFHVAFLDERGDEVTRRRAEAYVPSNSSTKVTVRVDDTRLVPRIDHCVADGDAKPVP